MNISTSSSEETYEVGYKIGQNLKPGSILCIEGEMGAGKTALAQGIIRGLGIKDDYITSPTYTIVNEYSVSGLFVYHFDVYRISDYYELQAIGFEEYLRENSIAIIEWADLFKDYLPEESIWINIVKRGLNNREIIINYN